MSGFTLRIRGGRAGLSALQDTDSAPNFLLSDAGIGMYTGVTLSATHPMFTVTITLLDDSAGKFTLEPVTNRVMTAVSLPVGTYTILAQAASSDGISSTTQTFTIMVSASEQYFASGWFAPKWFNPDWFKGLAP